MLGAITTNLLALFIYCIFQYILNPEVPVISLISASLCVIPISYLFNRNLVFDSTNTKGKEFARFIGIYLSAIVVSSFTLVVILQLIVNPYLAQLINMISIGVLTFITHSKWTFVKIDDV